MGSTSRGFICDNLLSENDVIDLLQEKLDSKETNLNRLVELGENEFEWLVVYQYEYDPLPQVTKITDIETVKEEREKWQDIMKRFDIVAE